MTATQEPPRLIADSVIQLEQLYELRVMRQFLEGGGELYLATEHQTIATIAQLYSAGHRHFAEKYVMKATARFGPVLSSWTGVRLSCYGSLQTNKVKKALHLFQSIESIDSERLAQRIRACLDANGGDFLSELLIQINQGREVQKSGVWPENAQRLIDHCRHLALPVVGLMTIPPRHHDPEPYFRQLRTLADANQLHHCQMGMTDDWQQAVRCGATRIRIGRGVFGTKAPSNGIIKD